MSYVPKRPPMEEGKWYYLDRTLDKDRWLLPSDFEIVYCYNVVEGMAWVDYYSKFFLRWTVGSYAFFNDIHFEISGPISEIYLTVNNIPLEEFYGKYKPK